MLRYTQGNLLDAQTEAVVNTVNTIGVMGKGIALMFKEAFPENTEAYEAACKQGEVHVGRMFVTENHELTGPKWIINFPTKKPIEVRRKLRGNIDTEILLSEIAQLTGRHERIAVEIVKLAEKRHADLMK